MNEIKIPLLILNNDIDIPQYAYLGDAGIDLQSTLDLSLEPFQRELIPCGFALALPDNYCALVCPRSGLAVKHGISIVNAPGVIDAHYRGEIKVCLINLDPYNTFHIEKGMRIAQMVVQEVTTVDFQLSSALPQTERGEKGFGSSGC